MINGIAFLWHDGQNGDKKAAQSERLQDV